MLWLLLLSLALAAPDLTALRLRAAQLDTRRGSTAAQLEALTAEALTVPAEARALALSHRLRQPVLPPAERRFLLAALDDVPASCAPDSRLPLPAQIDRVRRCADLPALLETFARSRLGDLPEDPDLFERALRGALSLAPSSDVPQALRALAPRLAPLVRQRLSDRWLAPLAPAQLARAASAPLSDSTDALTGVLLSHYDRHGVAMLSAMQTERGSLLSALLDETERAIAAAWAADPDPALSAVGAAVLSALGPPPEDTDALPAPPGWWPGTEPVAPSEPATAAWHRPAPPRLERAGPLLLGLLLMGAAGGLGARVRRARPLAAGLLGVSALLVCEGGLRLAGVAPLAQTRPLFSFTDWQLEVFTPDPTGTLLSTEGRWIRQQTIRADRPDFRAVTLGASSAHGSNHLMEETFSALLEQRLRARWPDERVEVLNLGVGGTTSNGVLHVGQAALELGADLLLVYYGHNEVAQFSQLAGFSHTRPRRLAWRIRLGHSRLYSALARLLQPAQAPMVSPTDAPVRAESSKDIALLKRLAVENYRYNLDQLLRDARDAGCEVILMNVATNYRFVDLAPLPSAAAQTLDAAHAARGAGDLAGALAEARAVYAEAPPGSGPHLEAARLVADLLAEQGDGAAGRAVVQAAIDASAQPGVVTSGIRSALWELSEAHGAPLLDVDRLFYARSPDGLSAPGLFWDDLHPTRWGHQLIAEALSPAVEAAAAERLSR